MRTPPQRKPPPLPPEDIITTNIAELLRTPTYIDCGAEGHIVRSKALINPHTIQSTNMLTETFSGATAPITHVGSHISGLFPRCHLVPTSLYNLMAVGPHLDHHPDYAIILTANKAIQLEHLSFEGIEKSPDKQNFLIQQLQRKDKHGKPIVNIRSIGSRQGPGSLYETNLFDPPVQLTRSRIINCVRHRQPLMNQMPRNLKRVRTNKMSTKTPPPLTPNKFAGAAAHPDPTWTTSTTTERALLELRSIHCSMGHPSDRALLQALDSSSDPHHHRLRKYVKLMDRCNICPAGSQRSEPHSEPATTRAAEYLTRLFLDFSGRQPVASLGGNWYFLLIVDDCTRKKWTRGAKSVTQVAQIFDNFLRTVVRQGTTGAAGRVRVVSLVRTDNGPDFNTNTFRQVLQLHSITHEASPPDASQQRGVVERGIGVLSQIGRSNLYWAISPLPFWMESVKHANVTSDNSPNSSNPDNKSPFAMVNPDRPSQLSKLRPFGCLTFTHVKVMDRNGKLNSATTCGFLCGYGLTPDGVINGYRIMNFRTQRITTKYNVAFNVHVPALRYILCALTHSPQQMLVGRQIIKRFDSGTFIGTITGHSTKENVTLYNISYDDGDAEEMELMEVLAHIRPIQSDMSLHKPAMHKRLRMATPSDRSKIGSSLLPPPTPIHATGDRDETTSKLLLRQSSRKKKSPNKLTSVSLGSNTDSTSQPLLKKTHTRNKAYTSTIKPADPQLLWKRQHRGDSVVINLASKRPSYKPTPNAIMNGIKVHRYSTTSPPLPKVPARAIPKPADYDDAVFGPFNMFWRPAIQREIDSLFHYNVWRLERLPAGALVLPCKMVLKVKPDGRTPPGIDKFKGRYCGKGFHQRKGVHFISSHAPVSAGVTVMIIFAVAVELGWPLHGMDVNNAYLNADLDERIVLFVEPPPTVHVPPGYGLRLLKGLYGTMQGGNRWAVHKHKKLTEINMQRNAADPSLYHRLDEHGLVICTIIVDDFALTGWPPTAVARLKVQLSEIWDMTDLGPLRFFAGIEIKRNESTRQMTLKQSHYVEDMLSKYGLADTYGKPTPCTTTIYKQRLLDPVNPHPTDKDDNYGSQVGTLGYLRHTRPDLCVAIGVVSQFVKLGRHGPPHFRALRNIMRHAKKTMRYGLHFRSLFKFIKAPWIIKARWDSDWATWKGSRRSRTGWLIWLNMCLIAFGSKLQPSIALSSAEAEYMALSHVIRILLWILNIIRGIPGQFVQLPIDVCGDNKPAICLANNHAASKFTRHIGIQHHFLRDHCEGGDRTFNLTWVNSKSNTADGMTKPLARAEFIRFRDSVVSDIEF